MFRTIQLVECSRSVGDEGLILLLSQVEIDI